MNFEYSKKSQELLAQLKKFMSEFVMPYEETFMAETRRLNLSDDWRTWQLLPQTDELKNKARTAGLWNLFLPDEQLGAGLSTLEYAPLAEEMGRSLVAPELFNCNAPDTGNMEVLYHYGSDRQKERWLQPLLDGKIRSVFCMTEPGVASSDATNMAATIRQDGDDLIINGRKWWATGIGHPNARLIVFMGLSDAKAPRHERHSMVLVPVSTPGVNIKRMLTACGDYDPPYGHGEVHFENVRVPRENLLVGSGQGFAIAQGRLGPGRIHHCMRCIGAAERALELTIARATTRQAFGRPLVQLGGNRERIAQARMAIDQARLLALYTAWKIDQVGGRDSMTEISAIKVVAPNVLQRVVDMAMQIHGGAGVCGDFPLMGFYTQARTLRLADGPDEVHMGMVSKLELERHAAS